jgi:queuine/archaeosine tRNA-ribosyltransferase
VTTTQVDEANESVAGCASVPDAGSSAFDVGRPAADCRRPAFIQTRRGAIALPCYMPVTTGDPSHATDALVRPFLGRLSSAALTSYLFSRASKASPLSLPLFVDSGGFRLLEPGAWIEEDEASGTASIAFDSTCEIGQVDRLTPQALLAHQEEVAELGSTLDFPIPLSMADQQERERRLRLTVANARWALAQASGRVVLFGSVQGWDSASYARCARLLVEAGFQHLAIGGLVPRLPVVAQVLAIVRAVLEVAPPGGLVHCFGVGDPKVARMLFDLGVASVDSSSYVRQAVSGKRWDGCEVPEAPSTLERGRAALANLAYAAKVIRESASA